MFWCSFRFSFKQSKASGYQPEQVDTILLTHLHPDHVCGISKDGVSNFPNATVYVSNDEASFWLDPKQAAKLPKEKQANYSGTVEKIKQAIAPYQAKQRFKTYKLGDDIQGFKVINTAGHTPGHFSYELKPKMKTWYLLEISYIHILCNLINLKRRSNMILIRKSSTNPFKTICEFCQEWTNYCSATFTFPRHWTHLFSRWKKLSMDSNSFQRLNVFI